MPLSTTFVKQVFRDFTQFMDITDEEKKSNFLETMQNDYTAMLASMKHDPNKVYRKPWYQFVNDFYNMIDEVVSFL